MRIVDKFISNLADKLLEKVADPIAYRVCNEISTRVSGVVVQDTSSRIVDRVVKDVTERLTFDNILYGICNPIIRRIISEVASGLPGTGIAEKISKKSAELFLSSISDNEVIGDYVDGLYKQIYYKMEERISTAMKNAVSYNLSHIDLSLYRLTFDNTAKELAEAISQRLVEIETNNKKRTYNIQELADLLRIKVPSLHKRIKRGEIVPINNGKYRDLLFDADEIDMMIKAGTLYRNNRFNF